MHFVGDPFSMDKPSMNYSRQPEPACASGMSGSLASNSKNTSRPQFVVHRLLPWYRGEKLEIERSACGLRSDRLSGCRTASLGKGGENKDPAEMALRFASVIPQPGVERLKESD